MLVGGSGTKEHDVRRTAVAAGLAVLLLTTGCGASSGERTTGSASASSSSNGVAAKSADEILAAATAAAKQQSSVHVVGAQTSGTDTTKLDLTLVRDKGATGTISMGGNEIQLITVGGSVYMKADKKFWTQFGSAAAAAVIGDRWVKASATNSSFADLASLGDFTSSLGSFLKPTSTLTKGEEKTVDGTPAIGLVDGSGTLWVATDGEPLPIKIQPKAGTDGMTFSDWGADVTITPPAEKDTLDLSKLTG